MNVIDKRFNELVDDIKSKTYEEVFEHIKECYFKLSSSEQVGLITYLVTYPYWGKLLPGDDNYESFYNRTDSIKKHLNDYIWLYDKLEDYRSKMILVGVLDNWYNFNTTFLERSMDVAYKQYFDLDIVKCSEDEVIADLGAYVGDTVMNYMAEYGTGFYKHIYCYEISDDIFRKLNYNLAMYRDISFRLCAVNDKSGTVYIERNSNSNSANTIKDEGTESIPSVTLDEDIKEKLTMIKMDIEGAEKSAIKGASNHIKNDTPKLLLSVYHNHEDIYAIPKMVYKLNKNYKYYLRFYGGPNSFISFTKKRLV